MYYVSPTQISFIVPDFGVTTTVPTNTATIQVINNGAKSNAVTTRIYAAAPGAWTAGSDRISTGRIQQLPDFSLVSAANPVKPGDKIVIYCTGLGPVSPKVADGAAASSTTLSQATESIYVFIDGQQAPISSAGLTPGFVGLYQINATVPDGVTRGATVYLDVEVDDGVLDFAHRLHVGSEDPNRTVTSRHGHPCLCWFCLPAHQHRQGVPDDGSSPCEWPGEFAQSGARVS